MLVVDLQTPKVAVEEPLEKLLKFILAPFRPCPHDEAHSFSRMAKNIVLPLEL